MEISLCMYIQQTISLIPYKVRCAVCIFILNAFSNQSSRFFVALAICNSITYSYICAVCEAILATFFSALKTKFASRIYEKSSMRRRYFIDISTQFSQNSNRFVWSCFCVYLIQRNMHIMCKMCSKGLHRIEVHGSKSLQNHVNQIRISSRSVYFW